MRRLTYVSTAEPWLQESDLMAIMAVATEFNARNSITGVLITKGRSFLQVLEGDAGTVAVLMERIRADHRHTGVIITHDDKAVRERVFPDWSMRLVRLPEAAKSDDLGWLPAKAIAGVHDMIRGFSGIY